MESLFSNIDRLELPTVKKVFIVTHRLGDVDAFCATYALNFLLKKKKPSIQTSFIFPGGLDSKAEDLRKYFSVESSEIKVFDESDFIIVVDAGSPKLLDEYFEILKNTVAQKLLIDHHPIQEESKFFYNYLYVDQETTSSSELVLALFRKYSVTLPPDISNLLLLGVLFDTRHLLVAHEETIKNVSFLIESGARLNWGQSLLTHKRDRSEVIAKLKSLSRLSLYEAGEVIVAFVKVGSFHVSVANFLVGAGCDIVIAYGKEDSLLKGSIRCSIEVGRNELVALNVLAETLGKTFNGVGGGHRLASSFNIQSDENKFISTVLNLIQSTLSTKIRKLPLK